MDLRGLRFDDKKYGHGGGGVTGVAPWHATDARARQTAYW